MRGRAWTPAGASTTLVLPPRCAHNPSMVRLPPSELPPNRCVANGSPLVARATHALVTGGAGFIGSHLTAELLQRGYSVHVVDDLSTGSLDNLAALAAEPGLQVTKGTVADPAIAARACQGASIVFHLAGTVGVQRLATAPLDVMQRNLRCSEVMIAAAATAGVPLLLTSSSEVYGDGPVPFREHDAVRPGATEGLRGGYACAKAMSEWLAFGHAELSRLPVKVARLFNTVGPRQTGDHGMVLPRFVQQAVRGEPITVYGTGEQTRCFAHVGEVVRALVDLAESPVAEDRVFNVGSAVETTVTACAELVRALACSHSPIVHVPFDSVFPSGFVDPPRRLPSLERLQRAIGWVPSAPLATILSELIDLARLGAWPDVSVARS